jgi:mRNA interferase MazF
VNRGDVYLADLEPSRGAEANTARPVILVGNKPSLTAAVRAGRGVVTIVPCTSNLAIRGRMHVAIKPTKLNGLRVPSKAQVEQIRSVDVSRLVEPLGKLAVADVDAIDDLIRYHLSV